MAEDRPAEEVPGSGGEPYEQITHHSAPVEPGGETGYAAPEPEEAGQDTANAGVTFEPPPESDPEEFSYHTGTIHASKVPAAIEFIDVHKSFGRNHVLRGLNMEIPEGQVSMIMVLHNYVHVLTACDRVNLIQDGVITLDKPTSETSVQELTEIVVDEYRRARQAAAQGR